MADLLISPNLTSNAKMILRIDDSQDGDGGRALVTTSVATGSYATVLKIDSISGGRIRFDIDGNRGAWRSSAGTYNETISTQATNSIMIAFDPFTVAEVDYGGSSVEPL